MTKFLTLPRVAFLTLVFFSVSGLEAFDPGRKLSQYGAGLFWDQANLKDGPGYSLHSRDYSFFDGRFGDGLYWGMLTSANYHQRGKDISLDDHLVTLGWWGNPVDDLPFALNLNASPVLGTRIRGHDFLGSHYWGVGGTVGVFAEAIPGSSLGVSWEPVWIFANGGGPRAHDSISHEVVISLVMKQLYWQ